MSNHPSLIKIFKNRIPKHHQDAIVNKPYSKYNEDPNLNKDQRDEANSLMNADKYASNAKKYMNPSHIKFEFQPIEVHKFRKNISASRDRYEKRRILKSMLEEIESAKRNCEDLKRNQEVVQSYFKNRSITSDNPEEKTLKLEKGSKLVEVAENPKGVPYNLINNAKKRRVRSLTPMANKNESAAIIKEQTGRTDNKRGEADAGSPQRVEEILESHRTENRGSGKFRETYEEKVRRSILEIKNSNIKDFNIETSNEKADDVLQHNFLNNPLYYLHLKGMCACYKCTCGRCRCDKPIIHWQGKEDKVSTYQMDYQLKSGLPELSCVKPDLLDLSNSSRNKYQMPAITTNQEFFKKHPPSVICKRHPSPETRILAPFFGSSSYQENYPDFKTTNQLRMSAPSDEYNVLKGIHFSAVSNYRKDFCPRDIHSLDREKNEIVTNRRRNREKIPCQSNINLPLETVHRLSYQPQTNKTGFELNADDFNFEKKYIPDVKLTFPGQYESEFTAKKKNVLDPIDDDCPVRSMLRRFTSPPDSNNTSKFWRDINS